MSYTKSILKKATCDGKKTTKKEVTFGNGKVYYFQRTEGQIGLSYVNGFALCMTWRHFATKTADVESANNREDGYKLYPNDIFARYSMLKNAKCRIFEDEPIGFMDYEKFPELDRYRERALCGCFCERTCKPHKCTCAQEGLECATDEALMNCHCFGRPECYHVHSCAGRRRRSTLRKAMSIWRKCFS